MEDAKSVISKLLQDPYKKVLLQDYDRVLANRRNRKKLEEIEKEISWFNGKAVRYRVEDRQGFFRHFRANYGSDHAGLAVRYRSLCDYPSGQEPKILYFVLLLEKKRQLMEEFQEAHPLSDLKTSISLTLDYKKIVNEYRLLAALFERMPGIAQAVISSIDECFVTDFLDGAEKLPLNVLQNRFYRAVRLSDSEAPERLLELIRKAGAKDTLYMETVVQMKKKDYRKALELINGFEPTHPSYKAAKAIALECCANTGNIKGFCEAFSAIEDTKLDAMYFIYMLQTLVCSADYKELDTDEFEDSVQTMLKSEFNQTPNPAFTGMVSRKFVSILLEGEPLAEKLAAVKKESGEDAFDEEEADRLYRLQMALQLYPVEEVCSLIDVDYIEEHGAQFCRQRLGRQALAMLLEKNPDKSFENIYLAFQALEQMGMTDAYVRNIEANLVSLVRYGENGQTRAYEMIRKAYDVKRGSGEDASVLGDALAKAELL